MSQSPSLSFPCVSHQVITHSYSARVLLNPGEVPREALPLVALGGEQLLPAEQHSPERRLQRRPRRRALAVVLPANVQL